MTTYLTPQETRVQEKIIRDWRTNGQRTADRPRVGAALARLRDGQGYRTYGYHTAPGDPFATYLRGEFKMELSEANELIAACQPWATAESGERAAASAPAGEPAPAASPQPTGPTSTEDDVPGLYHLDDLTIDPEIQLVNRPLDFKIVVAYAEAIANGAVFPPIVAFSDPKEDKWFVADGFHRVQAHRAAQKPEIGVDLKLGSRQDAMVYAATANVAHGRAMCQAEKREAGERLLRLTDLSNREIARKLAVSEGAVRNWQTNLSAQIYADSPAPAAAPAEEAPAEEAPAVRTVTRAGQTYTMRTANIGRSPAPSEGEGRGESEDVDEATGEVIDARTRAFQKAAEYRAAAATRTIPVNGNGGQHLYDLEVEEPEQAGEEAPAEDQPRSTPTAPARPPVSGFRPLPKPARAGDDQYEELLARANRTANILRTLAENLGNAARGCDYSREDPVARPCGNIGKRLLTLADYLEKGAV